MRTSCGPSQLRPYIVIVTYPKCPKYRNDGVCTLSISRIAVMVLGQMFFFVSAWILISKGPCRYVVYNWALKGLPCHDLGVHVCIITVHIRLCGPCAYYVAAWPFG